LDKHYDNNFINETIIIGDKVFFLLLNEKLIQILFIHISSVGINNKNLNI